MSTTARWALPYPQLDGLVAADVPQWLHDLAFSLDDHAKDDQGTLASRPVSTAGSPGKKGRYYMVKGDATASNNNILWRDNGTGWDQVGGGGTIFDTTANRPAPNAVPTGTRFFSTDQIAEWVSDGAAWHRVGTQPGDIIFTIEAAARTGYILLHGQAWPSTVGIYADLHTLWGGANLPDIQDRAIVAAGVNLAPLANDGVASANRHGLRHQHTPHIHVQHSSGGGGGLVGIQGAAADATSQGTTPNTSAADGGSGVATDPVDGGAFLVLQPQAKL